METSTNPSHPLRVLLPEQAEPYLGLFPEGLELSFIGESVSANALQAEFLVAAFNAQQLFTLMPQMPNLRYVQTISAGVDWILPHLPLGVQLYNGSGIHNTPVAEWVLAVLLNQYKDLGGFAQQQTQGVWKTQWLPDLEGSTVLIVGYGAIGQAVEERLKPFGVNTLRIARQARPGVLELAAWPQVLPQADTVVLLLPLTPDTQGLVNSNWLGLMKPGALLINAGRGGLVNTQDLLHALQQKRIRAALDVTDPEPLPDEHPLWQAPGVLITPHIAGSSLRLWHRAYSFIGQQLVRLQTGQPLHNKVESGY